MWQVFNGIIPVFSIYIIYISITLRFDPTFEHVESGLETGYL